MQRGESFWGRRDAAPTHYAYDDAGRLSCLRNLKSDVTPICTFAFQRDPNGNITESLREDGSCWYYAYDGLQRLTGADWKASDGASIYAHEYAYDKVGNRTHIVENGTPTYGSGKVPGPNGVKIRSFPVPKGR